ncbi:MAG TPA: hypothetical protein VGO00_14260, partial [Kofleriaceae bacterium]|nr:hypothetical protein [Kofleriaceae bacterium]
PQHAAITARLDLDLVAQAERQRVRGIVGHGAFDEDVLDLGVERFCGPAEPLGDALFVAQ